MAGCLDGPNRARIKDYEAESRYCGGDGNFSVFLSVRILVRHRRKSFRVADLAGDWKIYSIAMQNLAT